MAMQKFEFPEFYSFPPFFTIQPVLATREKQLALWRELILRYHSELRIKTMKIYDCPLWKNPTIDRQLNPEEVLQVVEDFVQHGHGEWEDAKKTSCRILWRKPEELATDIYLWYVDMSTLHVVCSWPMFTRMKR
jgi:ESCRT-II complex subunit VPS25